MIDFFIVSFSCAFSGRTRYEDYDTIRTTEKRREAAWKGVERVCEPTARSHDACWRTSIKLIVVLVAPASATASAAVSGTHC